MAEEVNEKRNKKEEKKSNFRLQAENQKCWLNISQLNEKKITKYTEKDERIWVFFIVFDIIMSKQKNITNEKKWHCEFFTVSIVLIDLSEIFFNKKTNKSSLAAMSNDLWRDMLKINSRHSLSGVNVYKPISSSYLFFLLKRLCLQLLLFIHNGKSVFG